VADNLFDRSAEYDAMLDRGLRLSGENRHYFARGRLRDLYRQLPAGFRPRRILDFGCGLGDSARLLADHFPTASVLGLDTALNALAHAREVHGNARIEFAHGDLPADQSFDLCFVNGVFHHIEPVHRQGVVRRIWESLAPGGFFAFCENNPWNPGTRLVMYRIPFDRDAEPIPPIAARRLLHAGGFEQLFPTRFLFYFPRFLAWLRPMERWLARLPFGAQYYVLAHKP
jgi:SAM-dependent methyltransferase